MRSRADAEDLTQQTSSGRRQPLYELDDSHDALVASGKTPDLGLEPDLERALASPGRASARSSRCASAAS